MKPEELAYYRMQLRIGIYDEYDEMLDRVLDEEETLSPLFCDLALAMSDRNQTDGILGNYLLDNPVDYRVVDEMFRKYFYDQYKKGNMSSKELFQYMSRFVWDDDWPRDVSLFRSEVLALEDYYDLANDGIITQKAFETALDECLREGSFHSPLDSLEENRITIDTNARRMYFTGTLVFGFILLTELVTLLFEILTEAGGAALTIDRIFGIISALVTAVITVLCAVKWKKVSNQNRIS